MILEELFLNLRCNCVKNADERFRLKRLLEVIVYADIRALLEDEAF